MRSEIYFDRLIEKKGLKNDLGLAKYMGWSSGRMSQYRTGKRIMDNELCVQIAMELEMESPLQIIMAADMDRAERAGQKSLWEVFSPRMAHSGLMAILIALLASVTNFVTPSPAEAAPLSHSQAPNTLCYVKYLGWITTRLKQALRAIQARTKPATA